LRAEMRACVSKRDGRLTVPRPPGGNDRKYDAEDQREQRPKNEDRAHRPAAIAVEQAEIVCRQDVPDDRNRFADDETDNKG